MSESNHQQKVITLLVDIKKNKSKTNIQEYPELNAMFDEGMYIESFNQCRLTNKKVHITFVLRYYHST
ncbi:MAG: hypothetical protein ACK44D_09060 [Bacteroidia bacterium]|jgi:hypothetical protein